jgi:hypothetical protein
MTDTKHLNQVDLSRRFGISCRTLERWRWMGIGPKFIKIGGRVKYRLADVEAFEQSRLCQSTADQYYLNRNAANNPLGNKRV